MSVPTAIVADAPRNDVLQGAENMDETTLRLHRGKQASMVH